MKRRFDRLGLLAREGGWGAILDKLDAHLARAHE
jgi:hypothetical protein